VATLRVAVVAESPVVRAGLRAMLEAEPGIVVVASLARIAALDDDADDGDEPTPEAHVLVVARANGELPATARAHDDAPLAMDEPRGYGALVLLVDRLDAELARRALQAGAGAVLALDAGEAAILAAVHAAAAGLVTLPRELAPLLLEGEPGSVATPSPVSATAATLTPREREVLALLAQGLANKAIAPRLGITEHTVKAHVAAIYEKLGAGNRAEAAIAAARLGLLML
jgi:two-component system nitrate/nitrite response regulator NarL